MITWSPPKVCKIMAFWAVFSGFGLFFTYFGVQVELSDYLRLGL